MTQLAYIYFLLVFADNQNSMRFEKIKSNSWQINAVFPLRICKDKPSWCQEAIEGNAGLSTDQVSVSLSIEVRTKVS